ncbi:MAG: GDSL-type esterase/lipase family protein [Gammaproteobacteria bacterium]
MRIKQKRLAESIDGRRGRLSHRRFLPAGMVVLMLAGCGGGGGDSGNGNEPPPPPPPRNQPPATVAGCSTTPQAATVTGRLQATDRDNTANELIFSLDPTVPNVAGPIQTAKGTVQLLDTTTGEFAYTPNELGPRGLDSFEFRVDDPESFSVGTETVIINPAIMPLGDSITVGTFKSNTPPEPQKVGYRRKLFSDLTAEDFEVDFVGSLSNGQTASPPIGDPQHEGHGGFTAAQIAANIRTWLMLNPPDIVLLHIGTNNINTDNLDPVTRAMQVEQTLETIDQWEIDTGTPVTVFLAKIIDRSNPGDNTFPNLRVEAYNQALEDMVAGRPTDDVRIVDQYSALSYPSDMVLQDAGYIHPNQTGYNKMADVWKNSLLSPEFLATGKLAKCE